MHNIDTITIVIIIIIIKNDTNIKHSSNIDIITRPNNNITNTNVCNAKKTPQIIGAQNMHIDNIVTVIIIIDNNNTIITHNNKKYNYYP